MPNPAPHPLPPIHATVGLPPFQGSHHACWHPEHPESGALDAWTCCWCWTVMFVPGDPIPNATVHGPYADRKPSVDGA
jgi:hypothetical protein